jgi:RAQPRD family integrative conjugative element protein
MKQKPMKQTLKQKQKQNPSLTPKPQKRLTPLSLLTHLCLLTQLTLVYPTQASTSNDSLPLKKIEHYIRNSTYLIDEAQALQNNDARYRFKYPLLRQDLSEIANSINRYLTQDKRSQAPRLVTPLVKAY